MMFYYDYDKKKRKPFKISTKKIEWMDAGGHSVHAYLTNKTFIKTSKCRVANCKRPLRWGDGTYEFDHKNNNPADNSQKNCYLVCRICHGKHTKIAVKKERGLFGEVIGYKTIKKKVGYKKPKRTVKTKAKTKTQTKKKKTTKKKTTKRKTSRKRTKKTPEAEFKRIFGF